jgi:hypothetical protein
LAEVRTCDIGLAEVWHDAPDVLCAVVNHAKATAGELRIAAALLLRGAFEQGDFGSLLGSRKCRAQSSIPSTHDYDIVTDCHAKALGSI